MNFKYPCTLNLQKNWIETKSWKFFLPNETIKIMGYFIVFLFKAFQTPIFSVLEYSVIYPFGALHKKKEKMYNNMADNIVGKDGKYTV